MIHETHTYTTKDVGSFSLFSLPSFSCYQILFYDIQNGIQKFISWFIQSFYRSFHAHCALESTGECPKLWTCRICAPKPDQNGLMKVAKRSGGGGKFGLKTSAALKGRTGGGRDSMPNSCENGSVILATKELSPNQLFKKRQNHLEELFK